MGDRGTTKLLKIHPGEILREEFMTPLALSANALALALRVPATRISEILHERRGLSTDTAVRLGLYFGTSTEFWMRLQTAYDVRVSEAALLVKLKKEIKPRPGLEQQKVA
jgi:addiction module HigA family antidote